MIFPPYEILTRQSAYLILLYHTFIRLSIPGLYVFYFRSVYRKKKKHSFSKVLLSFVGALFNYSASLSNSSMKKARVYASLPSNEVTVTRKYEGIPRFPLSGSVRNLLKSNSVLVMCSSPAA